MAPRNDFLTKRKTRSIVKVLKLFFELHPNIYGGLKPFFANLRNELGKKKKKEKTSFSPRQL